jgi:transposase
MAKKYIVKLSEAERENLKTLIRQGKQSARTLTRAHILLLSNEGQPDRSIAQALHVHVNTVERIRAKFVEDGVELALRNRPIPGARRKLDGEAEAFLVATACTDAPNGRAKWTMQLLADELVRLELVDEISDETVRRTLRTRLESTGNRQQLTRKIIVPTRGHIRLPVLLKQPLKKTKLSLG